MIINERKTGLDRTSGWIVYLLLYLPLCLLPAVKYSIPYAIAGLFSMLPLMIVALRDIRYQTIFFFLVVLGLVQGSITFLLENAPITEIVNEPIRSVRYFVPCVLLDKVFSFGKKSRIFIWIFATALIGFVIFQTLTALESAPMVARLLAQGSIEDQELMRYRFQNVGGFGNCYSLCLTIPIWVYFIFRSSKVMKIISAAITLFIFYFTLQVQYMTMLLLCIVAFLVVVFYSSKSLYAKLLGLAFALFVLIFLSSILRWLASLGVDSTIYTKLTEFADTLEGANALGDTTTRTELYKNSILAFLSNPLFGVTNNTNAHSTVLAYAANSGIIGLFAYFYGVRQIYTTTKCSLKEQNIDIGIFNIIFVLFVVLAVVNPVHYVYEISVMLLFYIPLTLNVFSNTEKSE